MTDMTLRIPGKSAVIVFYYALKRLASEDVNDVKLSPVTPENTVD